MDRVDPRHFASAPEGVKATRWRPDEVETLRLVFPTGGINASLEALPGRERQAIFQKAARLGLRAPRTRSGIVAGQVYESSPHIDAEIRRVYEISPSAGQVKALARALMRPRQWIHRRASKLGLATPVLKQAPWSPLELEVLEANAHKSARQMQRLLERAGFRRTEAAIAVKVHRAGFDRSNPDEWTGTQLAKLLGVSSQSICRWIKGEGLPAKRKGTDSPNDAWIIERAQLRRWIAAHPQLVDLRKVERYWFLDLAFGRATTP